MAMFVLQMNANFAIVIIVQHHAISLMTWGMRFVTIVSIFPRAQRVIAVWLGTIGTAIVHRVVLVLVICKALQNKYVQVKPHNALVLQLLALVFVKNGLSVAVAMAAKMVTILALKHQIAWIVLVIQWVLSIVYATRSLANAIARRDTLGNLATNVLLAFIEICKENVSLATVTSMELLQQI